MKNGYQLEKEYNVATWNCHIHSYKRNRHLHNYNRNSHVHNALQKILPAWLRQKDPPDICYKVYHQHNCKRTQKTCIIATDVGTSIIDERHWDLHNYYRKCQLHSSNRSCHLQNCLQKLSLAEMVPVRDPFSHNREI